MALLGGEGAGDTLALVADTSLPAEPDWNGGARAARPDAEALDDGATQARLAA